MSEEEVHKPTSMKGKLGDKYPQWYARHRLVENQRVWRLVMEDNPMKTVPDFERELPTDTYDLDQAFYHYPSCKCGSCVGEIGVLAKAMHKEYFPDEPWFRGALTTLPELPHQILLLLQDVEAKVLSPPDHPS